MTYAIHEHKATQVVQVNNLLNEFDNKEILQKVDHKLEEGYNNFIVDLSEVDFMNSVGLNFLLAMMNNSKKVGGYFAVANANEQILNLLEVTKLKKMFELKQSVEEALQHLEQNQ